MAYDLIVKATQVGNSSRSLASVVTEEIRRSHAFRYCEISSGPSEPGSMDIISLEDCLATGECAGKDFAACCSANGLPNDAADERSAAAFLDSLWGITLTFIKLPQERELVIAAYAQLIALAKAREYRINDPQLGRDINLNDPGDVPPVWQ